MNADFVIRLEKQKKWKVLFSFSALAVAKPDTRTATQVGKLTDAPAALWGPRSGYASGNVDVKGVASWLGDCLGEPILNAIREEYDTSTPDRLRLVITATDELQIDMMKTPWEIIESFNSTLALPYGERLSVVRVLQTDKSDPPDSTAGDRLRIAVLWANPRQDIIDLNNHLADLTKIGSDYENEISLLGPVEFRDPQQVIAALRGQHPQVVYHIGHAEQRAGRKVHLLIGAAGQPQEYDVEKFRGLLQMIGPPRVLLLNSCAAMLGYELNPYLGAALSCAEDIDGVIAMQTVVPQRAATQFAKAFLRHLANGNGLADSVKRGRIEIAKGEKLRVNGPLTFKPYIPTLVQKTNQDRPLIVDIDGRKLRLLLNKIRQYLVNVEPYLKRAHDGPLRKLLESPSADRRVSLVTGPGGSGKSTSVVRVILELLTEDRYRKGKRCLYYKIPDSVPLVSEQIERQINLIFHSFAERFSDQTGILVNQLKSALKDTPDSALPLVASWLEEEEQLGRQYYFCIDNVPATVATEIAQRASSIINGGYLMLIGNQINVPASLPVEQLSINLMTTEEIGKAAEDAKLQTSTELSQAILKYSGGLPYFVAAWMQRAFSPQQDGYPEALARGFLESHEPALTDDKKLILSFAAFCNVPIPMEILAPITAIENVESLVTDRLLLPVGEDAYQVPDALREYLISLAEGSQKSNIHEVAFNVFTKVADAGAESFEERRFQLVTEWYREAFRHALSVAELNPQEEPDKSVEFLNYAQQTAQTLHERYLERQDQVAEATSLWEQYRTVAFSMERYDDRDSDIRYADCLIRIGNYDQAEEILEPIASGDERDGTRLLALFHFSNLIKDRGRANERAKRVELLQQALTLAAQLKDGEVDQEWLQDQTAALEHSLGNALSYGKDARPDEAIQHLTRANDLYEKIGSRMQVRTISELIEVKRYTASLELAEREEAIKKLLALRHTLVTRDMRYDAILISYELGRLELDPSARAAYYKWATEKAGNSYEPLNLHAAIHWRVNQVAAGEKTFREVAPLLEKHVEQVARWRERAWSRRIWRNTALYLAANYLTDGNHEQALRWITNSWQAVEAVANSGEGRQDEQKRHQIGILYGRLLLQANKVEEARNVAHKLLARIPFDERLPLMERAGLEVFFSQTLKGAPYE